MPFEKLKHIDSIDCHVVPTICNVCLQSRMHRCVFHVSIIQTKHVFEMLHVDLWGPYRFPTYDGHRYFITIVDDFSRATWVQLFFSKTNAFPILQSFIAFIENQFQTCVKCVRSDNDMEFCDSIANSYYQKKGILHQTTCIQTPQQNGVVERKHKHLLEVAKALFFQSALPIKYWGDCLLTACYLIKSPYKMLYNSKPHYAHLKSFGCLCNASTPAHNRQKFQPRAMACVFLWYPFGKKAYKLLNLATRKVFYSRDVHFYEEHYPFHHLHYSETTTVLPTSDMQNIFFPIT